MANSIKFRGYYEGTKAEFIANAKATADEQGLVVYIQDLANNGAGACIYAQGSYFGNFSELIAALAFVKGVNVGGQNYNAANGGGYVKFEATDPATVAVNAGTDGIAIGLTPAFIKKVNDVVSQSATIFGDYLKAEDRTALEQLIATSKSEVIGQSGDASSAETIYGVKKYVDEEIAKVASSEEFTGLQDRVKAIEDDYLVEADKTELSNSISGVSGRVAAIEGDYLKAADKNELNGLIEAVGTRVTNEAPVTMTEAAGSGDILKSYTFTQNGKTIGTINLAKDLVVTGGDIVEKDGVKYLQLTIANQENPVEIPVSDLVDVYTGGEFVSISEANVISVDKDGIIAGLATDANAQQYASNAESAAKTYADGLIDAEVERANGAYDAKNAAANALAEAKTYAEGEADAAEAAAKSYADGLAVNYATAAQGAKADAAAPASTVYTKSEVYTKTEVDAMFSWVKL